MLLRTELDVAAPPVGAPSLPAPCLSAGQPIISSLRVNLHFPATELGANGSVAC